MIARELEELLIDQFGPDFREKMIVGPLGSFRLADAFEECGLEDPRRPRYPGPEPLGLAQPMSMRSFRPASPTENAIASMRYIRRYSPARPG